jgi:hypothetical protein
MRTRSEAPAQTGPDPLTPFVLSATGLAALLSLFGALAGGWIGPVAGVLAAVELLIAIAAVVQSRLARPGAALAARTHHEFGDQFERAFFQARSITIAALVAHAGAALMLAGLLSSLAMTWIAGALSIGIAVFLCAGALVVLIAALRKPLHALTTLTNAPAMPQPHVALAPDASPALWSALTALADEMQTAYVDRVLLGGEPGVYRLGQTVYLSLATLRVSTMDELGAMLAHEFAHTHDDAPQKLMLRLHHTAAERLTHANSARWLLSPIVTVIRAFTAAAEAANRAREIEADRAAAAAVGAEALGVALTRALIAPLWWERARQSGASVFETFEAAARARLDVPDIGALNQCRAPHPRDLHPTHLVRMTTLQLVAKSALTTALAVAPPSDTAIQLITNHEVIEMQLSSTPSRKAPKHAVRTGTPGQSAEPTTSDAPHGDVETAADGKRGLVIAASRGARTRMIAVTAGVGGFLAFVAALLVLNVLSDVFSGLLRSNMLFVLLVAAGLGGLSALLFKTARGYWAKIQANVPALRATSKGVRVYTEIADGDLLRWSELADLKVEEIEMAGLTQTLLLVPTYPKSVVQRLSLPRRLVYMAVSSVIKAPHFVGSGHVVLPISDVYRLLANYYKMNILDGAVELRTAQPAADAFMPQVDAVDAAGEIAPDDAGDAYAPPVDAPPSFDAAPAQAMAAPPPMAHTPDAPAAGDAGIHPLIAFAGETAQATLDIFVDALQNNPDDKRIVRAIRVVAPDESGDLVWLANTAVEDMDEGIFSGNVVDGPHPFAAPPGQRVTISHHMIIDWMLARDRVAQGAFTLRAERHLIDAEDRKYFDDAIKHSFSNDLIGFDFDARLLAAATETAAA